ncbi:MAG: hypothetical protein ACRCST_04360 [Turicibacter sp.]
MNAKDIYIKYKDFFDPQIEKYGMLVPSEWLPIIENCLKQLQNLFENKEDLKPKFYRINSKFHYLCMYYKPGSELYLHKVEDLIKDAELQVIALKK